MDTINYTSIILTFVVLVLVVTTFQNTAVTGTVQPVSDQKCITHAEHTCSLLCIPFSLYMMRNYNLFEEIILIIIY